MVPFATVYSKTNSKASSAKPAKAKNTVQDPQTTPVRFPWHCMSGLKKEKFIVIILLQAVWQALFAPGKTQIAPL